VSRSMTSQSNWSRYWIVNWWQDLLWFVATPLLLLPLFYVLLQGIPLQRLSILIISFGAVGHHLPGMIRAYGDSELFARYRLRFVLSPIFLLAVCIGFSFYRPDALKLVVLTWGFWHSQAQIYGFLRIYDSKVGLVDRWSALIDRFVCISWFAGGILMSSGRMADFFTIYYRVGGPHVSASVVNTIQQLAILIMAIAALAYLAHTVLVWVQGRTPSPVKILALIISIGFWWYCMVSVQNVVLGIALYEVFHDVQYLAIVWYFNRRRADTSDAAGWLTKALFRPRVALVLAYLGLIFVYGAASHVTRSMDASIIQTVLTGAFVASGLLHFYYDGFIWRIREQQTSAALGLEANAGLRGLMSRLPSWLPHASLWVAFCIPLAVFSFTPMTRNVYSDVARTLPGSAEAKFNLAVDLHKAGKFDLAEPIAHEVVDLRPEWSRAWALLGEIQLSSGNSMQAVEFLSNAVETERLNATAQFNLGNALVRSGQIEQATDAYFRAIQIDPKYETSAFNNLGAALLERHAPEDAAVAFERAVAADSSNVNALTNLADTYAMLGKKQQSLKHYELALIEQVDHGPAYRGTIQLLLAMGKTNDAENVVEAFRDACPESPEALCSDGLVNSQKGNYAAALQAFQKAYALDDSNFPAIYGMTMSLFQLGRDAEGTQLIDASTRSSVFSPAQKQSLIAVKDKAVSVDASSKDTASE